MFSTKNSTSIIIQASKDSALKRPTTVGVAGTDRHLAELRRAALIHVVGSIAHYLEPDPEKRSDLRVLMGDAVSVLDGEKPEDWL